MSRILEVWNSDVNRWHAHRDHWLRNSGNTDDSHAMRCVRLLYVLNPNASRELILAVAFHDVGERKSGDVPWGAKQDATMRHVLTRLECDEIDRLGMGVAITSEEYGWLKMVDRLDAYLWVSHVAKHLLRTPEWELEALQMVDRARECGVEDVVVALINEVRG